MVKRANKRYNLLDINGNPLAGGKVYTYLAGTTSVKKDTYSNHSLTEINTNPIILDAAGSADIFVSNGLYDFYIYDVDDILYRVDHDIGTDAVDDNAYASLILISDTVIDSTYDRSVLYCIHPLTITFPTANAALNVTIVNGSLDEVTFTSSTSTFNYVTGDFKLQAGIGCDVYGTDTWVIVGSGLLSLNGTNEVLSTNTFKGDNTFEKAVIYDSTATIKHQYDIDSPVEIVDRGITLKATNTIITNDVVGATIDTINLGGLVAEDGLQLNLRLTSGSENVIITGLGNVTVFQHTLLTSTQFLMLEYSKSTSTWMTLSSNLSDSSFYVYDQFAKVDASNNLSNYILLPYGWRSFDFFGTGVLVDMRFYAVDSSGVHTYISSGYNSLTHSTGHTAMVTSTYLQVPTPYYASNGVTHYGSSTITVARISDTSFVTFPAGVVSTNLSSAVSGIIVSVISTVFDDTFGHSAYFNVRIHM